MPLLKQAENKKRLFLKTSATFYALKILIGNHMKNITKILSASVCSLLLTAAYAEEGELKEKGERPDLAEVFTTLDADEDGFLSYEEFQLPPEREATEKKKKKRFAKIDTDGDGALSEEEFTSQKRSKKKGKGKKDAE